MPSPSSFLAFSILNLTVWPAFSLAYWYLIQREEEELMADMADQARSEAGAGVTE